MANRRRAVAISMDVDPPSSTHMIKCVDEEEVLQAVSSHIHPDDWPIFVLTDAVVVCKDGKTFANLLQAELDGPYTIRGKLEVDEEFRHLCLTRNFDANTVEVREVKGFSIGTGPTTIWANGKAGWFEIRPAPAYEKIYQKMVEGVELYYFLIDLYESMKSLKKVKGQPKTVSLDHIFEKYAQSFHPPLSTDEAIQHCEDHVIFFFSQMCKPGEPISWSHTTFYKWLLKNYPEEHARYTGGSAKQDMSLPAALEEKKSLTPPESTSSEGGKVKKRHREPIHAVILDFMSELHSSNRLRRKRMSIRHLSHALCEDFDIPSDHMASEIIKAHAKPLVAAMGEEWASSPIHEKLKLILNGPKKPKSDLRKDAAKFELLPRNKVLDEEPSADSGMDFVVDSGPRRPSRIGDAGRMTDASTNVSQSKTSEISAGPKSKMQKEKSFMLPESSTPSTRNKMPRLDPSDADNQKPRRSRASDDEASSVNKSPPRRKGPSRGGKVAVLRLVGTSMPPRQQSPMTSDFESSDGPSRKRRKFSRSPSDTEDLDFDIDEDNAFLQETLANFVPADLMREEIVEATTKLELVEEPLPSSSPPGPGGLWTCHREGCDYQVEGADKPEGRAQVHAHFLDHADQIAARENLAKKESRPHMPIDNLLEKLRSLGEAARLAEEKTIGGRVVPQPIKRQMAV